MSIRRVALIVLYACLGLSLAACAPMLRTHGYLPSKAETDALIIGIDTKATVEDAVGRPQDMGMRDGDSWYYVENTMSTYLFFAPEVAERTVLTLDFDPDGVLSAKDDIWPSGWAGCGSGDADHTDRQAPAEPPEPDIREYWRCYAASAELMG